MAHRRAQFLFVGISILLTAGPAAVGQRLTTHDVVARCVKALGGEANWRAIESMELSGKFTSLSQVRPFLIRRQRPNLYRFDHAEGIRELTIVYDGHTAWWNTVITVFSQANWPLVAREPYAMGFRNDAEFEWPFLNYRDRGFQIEFLGETYLELEPYLELAVTPT